MNLIAKIKQVVRKSVAVGVVTAAVAGAGIFHAASANAISSNTNHYDCDSNAVVDCGAGSTQALISKYDNGYKLSSAHKIHTVYNHFGISSAEVHAMNSTAVHGSVSKAGNVFIDGRSTPVATGAVTAGYGSASGGTKHVIDGVIFYTRPPANSFLSGSLDAYVVMKNGVFQFAILGACGNPVIAKPVPQPKPPAPKHPHYLLSKLVAPKGSSNYQNETTVKSGERVTYRIAIKSDGEVPVTSVKVNDHLPANVTYVNNTLKLDGQPVANDQNFFSLTDITIPSIAVGQYKIFTFDAIVGSKDVATHTCVPETLDNAAYINSPELPLLNNHAYVKKQCAYTFACNSLNSAALGADTFKFTANATANGGAKIAGYHFEFGDGQKAVGPSSVVNHKYAKPGTYNVTVAGVVTFDGQVTETTSAACTVKVTVKPPVVKPPTPTFSCDQLTAAAVNRTQYSFAGKASAANGAVIGGYSFEFGDGAQTGGISSTATHTYAAPGTYTAKLTALVSVNGKLTGVSGPNCYVKVTVPPAPVAECTGLTLAVASNRTATAHVTFTPGATLQSVSYDFGDNTAPVVSSQTSASHTFAADGNYVVKATLSFNVEGRTVTSLCQAPVSFNTPQPTYTCDAFDLSVSENRVVTATTFKTSVTNGASFTNAVIDWGDNSTPTTTSSVIGQTHTYAADGTYQVNVVAHFNANGVDVTDSGTQCQKQVTFTSTPPPVTPPTTPAPTTPVELVNTGPGSIIGLFALATAAGTFAYRRVLRRNLV